METRRICMTVRYDGTCFSGSQIQPGERTVAGTLTSELEEVTGMPVKLVFASRTDTGVHADGNVCSFDTELKFPSDRLPEVLNSRLPDDLRIRNACYVPDGFHPRFDATRRVYVYRVYRSMDVPVDRMRYCIAYKGEWNSRAVAEALRLLAGDHSFHNFCHGSEPPEKCLCRMESVVSEEHGAEVLWRFTANRFLRQMIRRLVAVVISIAAGEIMPAGLQCALAGEMNFQFKPAPAKGLTLQKVDYDER